MDHASVIAAIMKEMDVRTAIELGVRAALTTAVMAPHCRTIWGVDMADPERWPRSLRAKVRDGTVRFLKMRTDELKPILEEEKPVFDVAFIDACHDSHMVIKDFNMLFPYIRDNGVVFLHDVFPEDALYLDPRACSDCWKTPHVLKRLYGERVDIVTLCVSPGLAIVRKVKPLDFMDMESIDYDSYEPAPPTATATPTS